MIILGGYKNSGKLYAAQWFAKQGFIVRSVHNIVVEQASKYIYQFYRPDGEELIDIVLALKQEKNILIEKWTGFRTSYEFLTYFKEDYYLPKIGDRQKAFIKPLFQDLPALQSLIIAGNGVDWFLIEPKLPDIVLFINCRSLFERMRADADELLATPNKIELIYKIDGRIDKLAMEGQYKFWLHRYNKMLKVCGY
ncbi:MAG: hypothetical protein ACRC11_18740 [Xenococcaceae cyanobacterium]